MKKDNIFDILRVTTGFANETRLKPNILPKRALKRLKEYEDTGLTPSEILLMKETIANLQKKIKKSEDW